MFCSSSLHKKGELFEFKKNRSNVYWKPDFSKLDPADVDTVWGSVSTANMGFFKDDLVELASGTPTSVGAIARSNIDDLFAPLFVSELDLKRLYESLAPEPIFR